MLSIYQKTNNERTLVAFDKMMNACHIASLDSQDSCTIEAASITKVIGVWKLVRDVLISLDIPVALIMRSKSNSTVCLLEELTSQTELPSEKLRGMQFQISPKMLAEKLDSRLNTGTRYQHIAYTSGNDKCLALKEYLKKFAEALLEDENLSHTSCSCEYTDVTQQASFIELLDFLNQVKVEADIRITKDTGREVYTSISGLLTHSSSESLLKNACKATVQFKISPEEVLTLVDMRLEKYEEYLSQFAPVESSLSLLDNNDC